MGSTRSKKAADFASLNREELELIKLRKEVFLLTEQINDRAPKDVGILGKTFNYLQNNIGKIVAVIALIGGFVNPVMNYIGSERKSNLISVSNEMFNVLDSTVDQRIEKISTEDPNLVAPYLLNLLSENSINYQDAFNIYIRMYKLNTDLSNNTFYDKILFLFIPSNKAILENELSKSATKVFSTDIKAADESSPLIISTYIDIIYELKLEKKRKFKKVLDILRKKCALQDPLYKNICLDLEIKSK